MNPGDPTSNEPVAESNATAARQLRDFAAFIISSWGVLTLISGSLFPLAAQLTGALPLESNFQPLGRLPPLAVPVIATFVSLAMVFVTYTKRDTTDYTGEQAHKITGRRAKKALCFALAAITLYLVGQTVNVGPLSSYIYGPESEIALYEVRIVVYDLILSVLYIAFFVFATRFFLVLAVREYMKYTEN